MSIYLLRKHPEHPFQNGHLEAFTIVKIYKNFSEAKKIAKEKNKRSKFLYTVKRISTGLLK